MQLIQPYSERVPYMVGIGNHEFVYSSGGDKDLSHDEHFVPYWGNQDRDSGGECGVPVVKRFHMPGERSGGNGVFWHSYDFGSLHTVMLSSEHNFGRGSAQYAWLLKDFENVDRMRTPWLIVEFHRPMYNNEGYEGDYIVARHLQGMLEEVLVQYDVDLVLAGHYHSYLRSKRIYKDKADENHGIYHFTIGSAGFDADSSSVGLYDKDWLEVIQYNYGYGRITIENSTAMHWEFLRDVDNDGKGDPVDDVWILKKGVTA